MTAGMAACVVHGKLCHTVQLDIQLGMRVSRLSPGQGWLHHYKKRPHRKDAEM